MGVHAIIPAAVNSTLSENQRLKHDSYSAALHSTRNTLKSRNQSQSPSDDMGSSDVTVRNVSYGSTTSGEAALASGSGSYKGKEPALNGVDHDEEDSDDDEEEDEDCHEEHEEEEEELGPVIDGMF